MSPRESPTSCQQAAGASTAENGASSLGGGKRQPGTGAVALAAPVPSGGGGCGDIETTSQNDVAVQKGAARDAAAAEPRSTMTRSPSVRSMFAINKRSNAGSKSPRSSGAALSSPALLGESISNSAPTVLVHTPSDSNELNSPIRTPLRSIMSARTLHDSLHRGRGRAKRPGMDCRSISFAQVNIREYERVLGDNPSVTSGPPLSIGWRHAPDLISMDLDDYEEGRGAHRSSSEYLVPRAVREQVLREHAGVSRRELVGAVRAIQKEKAQRRKTVVNLNIQPLEERLEGAKRKIKKMLKPSCSYQAVEAKLWDDAHVAAVEKARRLEESLRKGESVSSRDLYRVGTPFNNIMPSRKNLMEGQERKHRREREVPTDSSSAASEGGVGFSLESLPAQQVPVPKKENRKSPPRQLSSGGQVDARTADWSASAFTHTPSILISEDDDDDIFAKLVLDDASHHS